MYVSESINAHVIPVLTYYQLLPSYPSRRHLRTTRDAGVIGLLFGGGARSLWVAFIATGLHEMERLYL